jgi:hypothetical protein
MDVIGAFGLAQQRGDPGKHPVIGHGATLSDGDDITADPFERFDGLSPHRNPSTPTWETLVRYLPMNTVSASVSWGDSGPCLA